MEKQDTITKAIGAVVVLVVSGGTGYGTAAVSIQYLEKKINAVELTVNQNKKSLDANIGALSNKIENIGRDVSYIRGTIDGAKGK